MNSGHYSKHVARSRAVAAWQEIVMLRDALVSNTWTPDECPFKAHADYEMWFVACAAYGKLLEKCPACGADFSVVYTGPIPLEAYATYTCDETGGEINLPYMS